MKSLLFALCLFISASAFSQTTQPIRNQFTTNNSMNAPQDFWIPIWNNVAKKWSNGANTASATNDAQPPSTILSNLTATGVSPGATNASAYIASAAGRGTNTAFFVNTNVGAQYWGGAAGTQVYSWDTGASLYRLVLSSGSSTLEWGTNNHTHSFRGVAVYPTVDSTTTLGDSTHRWSGGHFNDVFVTRTNSQNAEIRLRNFDDLFGSLMTISRARGLESLPTQLLAGDYLGQFTFTGKDNSGALYRQAFVIQPTAISDFTTTSAETRVDFSVGGVGGAKLISSWTPYDMTNYAHVWFRSNVAVLGTLNVNSVQSNRSGIYVDNTVSGGNAEIFLKNTNDTFTQLIMRSYGAPSFAPTIYMEKIGGTEASPTALASGETAGQLYFLGRGTTQTRTASSIRAFSAGTFTDASGPSILTLNVGGLNDSSLEGLLVMSLTPQWVTNNANFLINSNLYLPLLTTNAILYTGVGGQVRTAALSGLTFSGGVLTATGSGGGGPGTLPMNANQFDTNTPVSIKDGFVATNANLHQITTIYGVTGVQAPYLRLMGTNGNGYTAHTIESHWRPTNAIVWGLTNAQPGEVLQVLSAVVSGGVANIVLTNAPASAGSGPTNNVTTGEHFTTISNQLYRAPLVLGDTTNIVLSFRTNQYIVAPSNVFTVTLTDLPQSGHKATIELFLINTNATAGYFQTNGLNNGSVILLAAPSTNRFLFHSQTNALWTESGQILATGLSDVFVMQTNAVIATATNINPTIQDVSGDKFRFDVEAPSDSQALIFHPGSSGTIVTNGAAGGSQTPWTANVNGNGFSLTNVKHVNAGANINTPSQNPTLNVSGTNSAGSLIGWEMATSNSLLRLRSSTAPTAVDPVTISTNGAITANLGVQTTAGAFVLGAVIGTAGNASGRVDIGSGASLKGRANGTLDITDIINNNEFYGVFIGGQGPSNGLIRFQSSSIGNSNGAVTLRSGNTNTWLKFGSHDIGTRSTNWTADATSFVGYTNTTDYNQIWNIRGTSGNIVFWHRTGLAGNTAAGIAIWTNTIISSGSDIMVGVNCGLAIDTGVGVVGGGRAF